MPSVCNCKSVWTLHRFRCLPTLIRPLTFLRASRYTLQLEIQGRLQGKHHSHLLPLISGLHNVAVQVFLFYRQHSMGKAKKTRKFAAVKRLLNPKDIRLKENQAKQAKKETEAKEKSVRRIEPVASSLFLAHNTALAPPYRVLIDTNFINFSLQNKLELISGMMDCLYAKCIPCVTDCVMAELEKLGHKYRVALRVARDPRFERLKCSHTGTYADDCLVQRVTSHKCYIVATCDRELRRRIRQIPGIPVLQHDVLYVGAVNSYFSQLVEQSAFDDSDASTDVNNTHLHPMSNEDQPPAAYKYTWIEGSPVSLESFLTKFRPSMVENDGTKPWIWVHGSPDPCQSDKSVEAAAIKEATNILSEVTEKVENVKNDDSIPVRSNKKTGAKSKKEVREQIQAEATENLKEISTRNGYVVGKWLIFAPANRIDVIWSGIATSLVSGPLNASVAFLAKVSTSGGANPGGQHLICVYMPDVYDKVAVTEVMKILLRDHGVNLAGVKSDLYTVIGLDSKHPSGISSTVWKNTALLPEKEIKELKDAFFSGLGSKTGPAVSASEPTGDEVSGTNPTGEGTSDSKEAQPAKVTKAKPKLKKKGQDDPFASDGKGEEPTPKASSSSKRVRKSDGDQEKAETSKRKKTVK